MDRTATDPSAPLRDGTVAGILCMVGFAFTAPVMDAFAKATPAEVPVMQILGARFGVQVAVLVPLALALGMGRWPGPRDWLRHLLRGVLLLTATGCFFTALRFMPIANALSIFFVAPFILTILGGLMLKEEVGPRRIAACAVGFLGALLVIQPSFADLGAVALLPLGTALCFAFYMVLTRRMAQRTHPIALQAWTATAASAVVLPALWLLDGSGIAALDPVRPTGLALWTLAGVGVMATVSHLFISFALRLAPAATIAPLQYLEIVAAVALGYWVFGDFPDALTWAGIAVIVGAGLYVFARERRVSLRRRPLPPA
ncbi:EamA/RhaT family transporter [Rhodosalinus halophilus]|uniref:EamA/RhaT family transporter n=1 Tax=Rhodosalinus halophilus TaxID=2259333 RepID=A0A365UCG2_9RHOB|nr:EamA/RhaT family transporter [Rhodosalinus halophilus]